MPRLAHTHWVSYIPCLFSSLIQAGSDSDYAALSFDLLLSQRENQGHPECLDLQLGVTTQTVRRLQLLLLLTETKRVIKHLCIVPELPNL